MKLVDPNKKRRAEAATTVQRVTRGRMGRRKVEQHRKERFDEAATLLQAKLRLATSQRSIFRDQTLQKQQAVGAYPAATRIQSVVRTFLKRVRFLKVRGRERSLESRGLSRSALAAAKAATEAASVLEHLNNFPGFADGKKIHELVPKTSVPQPDS